MKKITPKVFQILAKTHRLTIFLSAPVTATITDLKSQALPALERYSTVQEENEDVDIDLPPVKQDDILPKVTEISDFEFCKAKRDRAGKIIEFDVLDAKAVIRETLSNWESIYFRFRNEAGKLQDVEIEEPVDSDQEEVPDPKGKRKEHPT
ncbi:hypothetical protein Clacol_001351 [Clathrus columnatus]|uniref:Uncharacterized protein n=1 Tax=Clathrus columnatus TaxID=1419009 RepID=A0AAV5A2B0_9AGAM|nr:hypothetical protein Clacol_001351 [Clathrus columnatus]